MRTSSSCTVCRPRCSPSTVIWPVRGFSPLMASQYRVVWPLWFLYSTCSHFPSWMALKIARQIPVTVAASFSGWIHGGAVFPSIIGNIPEFHKGRQPA